MSSRNRDKSKEYAGFRVSKRDASQWLLHRGLWYTDRRVLSMVVFKQVVVACSSSFNLRKMAKRRRILILPTFLPKTIIVLGNTID